MTRLNAFAPMRETRVYGGGGQFAKGGGRVPGRDIPARGMDDAFPRPPVGEVTHGDGIVEMDDAECRELAFELNRQPLVTSPALNAALDARAARQGAFEDESTRSAVRDYIGRGYSDMNNVARGGDVVTSASASQARAKVNDLERAFTPPPSKPLEPGTVVYRGVFDDDFGPTLSPGQTFVDHGFTSVSESAQAVQWFTAGDLGRGPAAKTVYRITTRAGHPVVAGNEAEAEWILPRHATFTVTGVRQFVNSAGGVHRLVDVDWDGVSETRAAVRPAPPRSGLTRFGDWLAGNVVRTPESRSRTLDPFAPMARELRARIFWERRTAGLGGQFAKGGGRIAGQGKPGGAPSLGAGELADFQGSAGASTWAHLESDGAGGTRFNAERHALHERIIEERLAGIKPPQGRPPELVMLGGGPGAGKSTSAGQLGIPKAEDHAAAWADPDYFKAQLPGYDPKNPGPVHEESSYLARQMTLRAHERGLDVVIDGVGDAPGSVATKVAVARAHGYRTKAVYSTTDVEYALDRNATRDRSVDPGMLRHKHAAVSRNFESIAAGDFDVVELHANFGSKNLPSDRPSIRVAHRSKVGDQLTVDSPADWSAFLAKGVPET